MGPIAYLFVSFIVFFITWKKLGTKFKEKLKKENIINYPSTTSLFEIIFYEELAIMLFFSLFWPIALSGYLMWQFLEKIYKKINNTN